jgi:hypothetical protein
VWVWNAVFTKSRQINFIVKISICMEETRMLYFEVTCLQSVQLIIFMFSSVLNCISSLSSINCRLLLSHKVLSLKLPRGAVAQR